MYLRRKRRNFETIKDTEFGTLSFDEYGDTSCYSCKLKLPISIKTIDVFFETSSRSTLPTDQQRIFLKGVVENYQIIIEKVIPLIISTYKLKDKTQIEIEKLILQPISLIIPQIDMGSFKWDMTLVAATLSDTFFIIYLENYSVLSVTLEKDDKNTLIKFLLRLLNGRS